MKVKEQNLKKDNPDVTNNDGFEKKKCKNTQTPIIIHDKGSIYLTTLLSLSK